ncbi:hypothetical protein Ahy_A07g031406 isoform D [Arachis hypogaea]|uniref:Uncharacterized protein n=1 Tax=Arachis hypogaea TaxID=3818 RepID=A0A445C3U9_ARAHY|nr:hypothetical protein Ahy_A07g031406 isoform D [Arachis hypogaea]
MSEKRRCLELEVAFIGHAVKQNEFKGFHQNNFNNRVQYLVASMPIFSLLPLYKFHCIGNGATCPNLLMVSIHTKISLYEGITHAN